MKKNKVKIILTFVIIIIVVIGFSLGVYAGYTLSAKEVTYTKPDGTQLTVKEALDDLRAKFTTVTAPEISIAEAQSDSMLTNTVSVVVADEEGKKFVVPAGYKVRVDATTNNAATVDKGIVIEDSSGNQYVWIPCTTDTSSTGLQFKRTEWGVENDNDSRASKDELTLGDTTCSEDDIANGLTEDVKTAIINQVKS